MESDLYVRAGKVWLIPDLPCRTLLYDVLPCSARGIRSFLCIDVEVAVGPDDDPRNAFICGRKWSVGGDGAQITLTASGGRDLHDESGSITSRRSTPR